MLGPDGTEVPAVGAGEVSLARAAARGIAAEDAVRALHAALDAGLLVIDVAAEEDAERAAGDAVRSLHLRDRAIVTCRVPAIASARDLVRAVQPRVEASLRATRLDALPLALLPLRPAWREASAWAELRGTCARLVREGKVQRWGAILDGVDGAQDLLGDDWLVALAIPLSACERAAEPLVAAAAEKHVAVLARRPLAGGALAGSLGPGVPLPPNDDRRALDPAALERIAAGVARLAAFTKRQPLAARSCDAARAQLERNPRIAELDCLTVAELALRFVIDRGAIALPRLHRREHLAEAISAASAPPLSTPERIFSTLDEL